MKKISLSSLCRISLIAALYFCLSMAFAPISFGNIQMRVAEALTILPAITPLGTVGVTLGCALTNFYGVTTGANLLGFMDIFIGSFATFTAAIATEKLKNVTLKGMPVAATLPPVIFNAVIIGGELAFVFNGSVFSPAFFLYALQVGAGQFLSCTILGLIVLKAIKKAKIEL